MGSTDSTITAREVASGDGIEAKLARLWANLLQREDVDLHDNYFALGGNSLLAVSLIARIETQLGVRLPLTSIIQAPTVAEFARLLETRGSHEPVVLVRAGNSEWPLFLVHDADGETILYRSLALNLNPAQSVYGLQPYSRPNHPMLHTRIEEIAAYHITSMRKIQARGPYLLGGLCAGGIIAFEIARQLERDGESVAMVALMDAADVAAKAPPRQFAKEKLERLSAALDAGNDVGKLRRVAQTARVIVRKAVSFTSYTISSRVLATRNQATVSSFRLCLKLGVRVPAFLRNIPVRTLYNEAKRFYRPSTPIRGELLLLRASSGVGDDEPHTHRCADSLMGWEPRSTHGVKAFDVPGGHSSMLHEPNARTLAEIIEKYIDSVAECVKGGSKKAPAAVDQAGSGSVPRHGIVDSGSAQSIGKPSVKVSNERATNYKFLLLSASSREGLEAASARLAGYLDRDAETEPSDVTEIAAEGAHESGWRRAVIGANRAELVERLRNGTGKGVWTSSEGVVRRDVAFILAGVGEQAAGVGRDLYDAEPAFRDAANECADLVQPILGRDLRGVVFAPRQSASGWLRGGSSGVLKETQVAQPAAFILDWALARMWMNWGVRPSAVLGYSVGEYVAAALAGVVEMKDSITMLTRRAQWIDQLAEPGVMLAVAAGEADLSPRLGDGVWLAAINSPQATVVGGRTESIDRLDGELQSAGIATRRVVSMNGTHTPLLSAVKGNLLRVAEGIRRAPPQIPMLSNVTGTWVTAADAEDSRYWGAHMCGTLRFEAGIAELLRAQDMVLLEIGPGAGLGAMVRQHPLCSKDQASRTFSSLPSAWDKASEREHVAGMLGRLWVHGVEIDWNAVATAGQWQRVALPEASIGGQPIVADCELESVNSGESLRLTGSV